MIVRRGAFVLPAVLLALVVAGCGAEPEPGEERLPAPEPAPSSAPSATPEPDATPAPTPAPTVPPDSGGQPEVAVPVYYVAETAAGFRLQREFHRVATADPASAAVREMLAAPTGHDPEYRSHWPEATDLRTPVARESGVIVVDLGGVGPAQVGTQLAHLTVQQLVFTVQGALQSTDPVRILVDGREVPELWGAVDTSAPVERGDPYALRSLVQIDAPAHGAEVGREVEVRGEAAVFEATVLWEVLRDGALVQKGFTSTTEGQRFAPFSFTVTLELGEYTVRIREDDPSGGEGRPVLTDDKTFTVVG
ncbi:MAG TPA: Gmad2 immunoglobulin-like domain-containing protein [Pseudonocardia sp.]|nr:Gmad2 immunoglobulin-like domain-containing protein [Pseudonocardia sp.]